MSAPPAFDPTRAADLFERFTDRLTARLVRRYPGVDEQLVADAVVEAIIAAAAPGGDASELAMGRHARDRLRVFFRSDRRRRAREEKSVTTDIAAAPSPADEAADRELAARDREIAGRIRVRVAVTNDERAALDLWLAGVTDPADLAAKLGIARADAVRVLARFRKRIERERRRAGS